MTSEIADILINRLVDLPFVDKYAGIVKPVVMVQNKVRKTFPAATRLLISECAEVDGNSSVYTDLCPDSRYKSLLYLEDRGTRFVRSEGARYFWETSFDLVCWLNMPRLGFEGLKYSAIAINGIISKFPRTPFNSGIFSRINIKPVGQAPIGQSPFSQYSYDEAVTQLLMYPYDYFVLSLSVEFCVNKGCISETAISDPASCLTPNHVRNAMIIDQDGNVVKYLKANERYTVIVASGIDEGGPETQYSILVVDPGLNT